MTNKNKAKNSKINNSIIKNSRSNSKDTIRRILQHISPYRFQLVLSLVFAVISVALTLYAPILIGNVVDLIAGPGQVRFAGIMPILIQILAVVLLTSAAQWLMNLCNNKLTYYVAKDIRTRAFHQLEILPLDVYKRQL